MSTFTPAPPVSEYTVEDGWPFNPGDLLSWAHPRGGRETGRYLRLDSDLIEHAWANDTDTRDALVNDDDSDDEDPSHPFTALVMRQHEEEANDSVDEAIRLSHEVDRITFGRAYGIQIRVTFTDEWPQDGGTYRSVCLGEVTKVSDAP